MYDNPVGLMQNTDGRIRLRVSSKTVELSYKKPLTKEGIKKEIEYEVEVSDFDTTQKILEAMEFRPTTSYERYRTTLKNQDGTKAMIDEYPFAAFLEIEGNEEKIVALAQNLGFSMSENLAKPCDALFAEWRQSQGLPPKPHMLFSDYDK
jgi:adenylate cyclase class 2